MYKSVSIKFDGYSASDHILPIKDLGRSLVGIDKILNTGMVYLVHGRLPKRGERFEFKTVAKEPVAGSFEFVTFLQNSALLLPLIQEFLIAGKSEVLSHFFGYVLSNLGGKKSVEKYHLDAMLELNRDNWKGVHKSQELFQTGLVGVVQTLQGPAVETVYPVGKSASNLRIAHAGKSEFVTIDEPTADAIRVSAEDKIGELQEYELEVDGIIHHSHQLKVIDPYNSERYVTAEVKDPVFEQPPNIYSDAAAKRGRITVWAKPVYRNGELNRLHIMDVPNP